MFSVILSGLGLLIVGAILSEDKTQTYGSKLEEYIVSNNPRDIYDVERLARKYDEQNSRGFL